MACPARPGLAPYARMLRDVPARPGERRSLEDSGAALARPVEAIPAFSDTATDAATDAAAGSGLDTDMDADALEYDT